MIEELKIHNNEPIKPVIFPIHRKVIVEKFSELDTVEKKLIHLSKTILKPGEYFWTIDIGSLVIERHTISSVPPLTFRALESGAYVYIFDTTELENNTGLSLKRYFERIDTLEGVNFFGKERGGQKLLCSSERNVLLTLKKYIPKLTATIQKNLNVKNTGRNKAMGKKTQLKKFQKLHKKIVEYLRNN